jgi:hypothetical protein
MEKRAMEKKLTKYNVELLGDIPMEREDGTMRVLVSQMGGCASMETCEIKYLQLNSSSTNTTLTSAHSWSSTLIG